MQRYVDWFLVIESLVRFCLLSLISEFLNSLLLDIVYTSVKYRKQPLTVTLILKCKKMCFSIIAVRTQTTLWPMKWPFGKL